MKSGFYRAAEYYWSQVAIGMLVFAPVTVTVGFNIQAAMAGYRPGTEPHPPPPRQKLTAESSL